MKKTKIARTRIISLLVLLTIVFAISLSGTGFISSFASFVINATTQPFTSKKYEYDWTDEESNEHSEEVYFDCYAIENGYSGSNTGIAIAWHNDENETKYDTPDYLEVPKILYDSNNVPYDVVAIYKGGFRYCDFSSISLPKEIQEIGEEAFAYCLKLTSFTLPYNCSAISPSMLMDCRELETFFYQTESGKTTTGNSIVKQVGDHAFINCVKLKAFNCPSSLVYVGDSAFNNCKKITTIFFPKTDETNPADVPEEERITLGNYAFAQCELLTMVYFDVNMWKVGQHVFNRCNKQKLNINYTGSVDDFEDPSKMKDVDSDWRDCYTALGNNEQFNFAGDRGKFDYDHTDACPGLYFTIDNNIDDLMLDQSTLQTTNNSWQAKIFRVLGNDSLNGTTDHQIDKNDKLADFKDEEDNVVKKYATIIQFEKPDASDFNDVDDPYYSNGVLKIPDTVVADDGNVYPVRVIDTNVFNGLTELTSVSFSKYLVQIRHHSFLGCDNIATLDFERCKDLLEVSYEVFHKKSGDYTGPNTALTSLILPNCLKYIGASAFYNFTMVNSFHLSNKTVFIAQSAFENLGSSINVDGNVDLVLPNTLRDGPVDQAGNSGGKVGAYGFKIWRYSDCWDECIQVGAFKNAKCLKTVTMQSIPTDSALWGKVCQSNSGNYPTPKDHNTLKPYRMGLQKNSFENCTSLVRFEANKLLYVIGMEAFKGCTKLKEMFLCTFGSKVTNVNDGCAWGFSGNGVSSNSENSIFGTSSVFTDLIVYIDDPAGPPKGNKTMANPTKWNSVSSTYNNEFSTSSVALVPSYDGVVRDNVKYYNLTSNAETTPYVDSTDFSSSCVAFIKKTGNYTITRCYCGNADITSTIDMSKFDEASNIKTIGSGSFGQMTGYLPSRSIILPTSVTTIGDRAFYRACSTTTNDRGMQKVTYKVDGVSQAIEGKTNYCILPPSVTSIGRLAFYNNCFESVKINGNLSYLGNTAFGVYPSGSTSRSAIDSIALGNTENTFMVSSANGGLYYKKDTDRKTLIYQPASFDDGDANTVDTVLRIDSDAYAVGARACANTTYSSVSISNNVSTIYGGAFTKCLSLESVSFGNNPGLKYIGACVSTPDTEEVWHGANCDAASEMNDVPGSKAITFKDYYGAFKDDTALATFDFTKLNNSLVKIGYGAFEGCTSLTNMVGTQAYSYYKWNSNTHSLDNDVIDGVNSTAISSKILDLSGCENLRAIGYQSFKNCTSIKYVHLPDNYDTTAGTALYLGSLEPESESNIAKANATVFDGLTSCRVLVGEKSETANIVQNTANNDRYPPKAFDGSNVVAYFHAESSSDIWGSGEAHYWYELPTVNSVKRFVLLNNRADATDFFSNSAYQQL